MFEEKNAEGFAKECAIVTHYRLKNDPDKPGKLMVDPNAKLEEELIVRPTAKRLFGQLIKDGYNPIGIYFVKSMG
jgi:prolyl-tRNA synthetase